MNTPNYLKEFETPRILPPSCFTFLFTFSLVVDGALHNIEIETVGQAPQPFESRVWVRGENGLKNIESGYHCNLCDGDAKGCVAVFLAVADRLVYFLVRLLRFPTQCSEPTHHHRHKSHLIANSSSPPTIMAARRLLSSTSRLMSRTTPSASRGLASSTAPAVTVGTPLRCDCDVAGNSTSRRGRRRRRRRREEVEAGRVGVTSS